MSWLRRAKVEEAPPPPPRDEDEISKSAESQQNDGVAENDVVQLQEQEEGSRKSTEEQEAFMGVKVRRAASVHGDYRGDYLDVSSKPYLLKILGKQGDKKVFFADRVMKFTGSGKIKSRILLMTDFAIYIVDPETGALKRRIALVAVEKLCLSELSDNFFAVIVPTEYDLLIASTRKSEIVNRFLEATKTATDYELEVLFSNSFEYNAAADMVKEVVFEEVEGGIKTRITSK